MPDKATPSVLAGVPVRRRPVAAERRTGFIVTEPGYGFEVGKHLTDAEADAAQKTGTLKKFTVPVKG